MAKRSKRKLTKHTKRRQAAPPSKTKKQVLRGKSGRFVAKADHEYFQRLTATEVRDVYNEIFNPEYARTHKLKQEWVKKEKIDRYDRAQAHYSDYADIPFERAQADVTLLERGDLPKPVSVRRVGDYNEYIWAYRGKGGQRAITKILIHDKFPPDTFGVTAYGTGYGKHATWAGTRSSTPLELLNDTSYLALAATGSGKAIVSELTSDPTAVWWELKLVTKGVIPHASKFTKVAKATPNRSDASKVRSGVTSKPAKHVRRFKNNPRHKPRKPAKPRANKASSRKARNRRKTKK